MLLHCAYIVICIQESKISSANYGVQDKQENHCIFSCNLVDPASSHMLVSKTKPCMSKYKFLYNETANSSLKQL